MISRDNGFDIGMLQPFGLQIIEDRHMVDIVEDWSDVRSPSRAARRRKRGFPQRIRIMEVPKKEAYRMGNKVVMHPVRAMELRRQIANRTSEGGKGE